MITQALSQVVYYAPSVLAHLVAFVVAAVLFPRDRRAAALLAGGTALQLLASIGSFGSSLAMTAMYTQGDYDASMISFVMGGLGIITSIVRAFGEVTVVAAVGAAVLRTGGAVDPVDPYGFPR